MASSFRENANTFVLMQGSPTMFVKVVVLQFRQYLVTSTLITIDIGTICFSLFIVDNLYEFHLDFSYLYHCFWLKSGKFGVNSIDDSIFNPVDVPRTLLCKILSSFDRNCLCKFK